MLELAPDSQSKALVQALINEGELHNSSAWAAHMTPSINAPALLGQLLAGLHNGNLLSAELYPQLAIIEQQLIDWFCQLFGQQFGHFTHGSSYANLEALWQAREQEKNTSKTVYGSKETHYSVIKACHILGLTFLPITTNKLGQINTGQLSQACREQPPLAIVATAGTTSSGVIDPLISCIDIAKEFNSWCHIDAAWGGGIILLPEQQHLAGVERADSINFDPHKAWGLPKPSSVLLYQQPLDLISLDIDYLVQSPKQTLAGSYGGELFLPLWFNLLNGSKGLIKQIRRRLEQAEIFYLELKLKTDWEVFHSPTGIICFKMPQNINLTPLEEQGLLSRSAINNGPVWRVVFASDKTSAEIILAALEPYF